MDYTFDQARNRFIISAEVRSTGEIVVGDKVVGYVEQRLNMSDEATSKIVGGTPSWHGAAKPDGFPSSRASRYCSPGLAAEGWLRDRLLADLSVEIKLEVAPMDDLIYAGRREAGDRVLALNPKSDSRK